MIIVPFDWPLEAWPRACERLGIDWIVDIPRTTYRFAPGKEVRDLGGGRRVTVWGCSCSLWVDEPASATVEDVLSYRPLEDDRGVRVMQAGYQEERRRGAREAQAAAGEAVLVTGLYYTLLFQFCIMFFGWERFLEAAASDPGAFSVVLDQLAEASRCRSCTTTWPSPGGWCSRPGGASGSCCRATSASSIRPPAPDARWCS